MTLDELIQHVEFDIRKYENPSPYGPDNYQDIYRSKAEYAKEILAKLHEVKNNLTK